MEVKAQATQEIPNAPGNQHGRFVFRYDYEEAFALLLAAHLDPQSLYAFYGKLFLHG